MVDKTVNILTRVIPRKPRSKNYQGSGITNIATYSKGASSGESTASTPHPTIEVVSKESYAALTDDNVLSSLRTLQEILKRIISSTSEVEASDENTYSALKIDSSFKSVETTISELDTKFLSKVKPDSTEHLVSFLAGLKLGTKYSLDENGNAKLNDIQANVVEGITALFNQIEATKVDATEADISNLTALTIFVKNLADVGNLNVKDTATILNAVIKGSLSSPKFVSGFLGEGFRLAKSSNGDWNLEIDNLIVRKVFQVFELLIQEVKHQGGVVVHSPAGGKITKVTDGGSYWKCEIESADTFVKDDLVLCQRFTGKVKRYWRAVTSAGEGYINLSKTDCEPNSAIPEEGDEIATLGNKTNTARQSAYLISVIGADAPYTAYYSGINTYSLEFKEHTRIGNLEGVVSPVFGPLKGSGALLENAYVQGMIKLQNGKSVETVIGETSNKLSGDIGKVQADLQEDINSSVTSVKDELGATITNVENSFNANLNSTKNELNTSIIKAQGSADIAKGLAQQAQDSIDGLEIGGRNLLPNSMNIRLHGYPSGDVWNQKGEWCCMQLPIKNASEILSNTRVDVLPNATYTQSLLFRTDASKVSFSFSFWSSSYGHRSVNAIIKKVSTDTYRAYATYQTKDNQIELRLPDMTPINIDGGTYIEFSYFKLEQGNKPTPWTPAIEDTEEQINAITKEIKNVEQRFEIAEGQINSNIKETTQLITEAKLANGESVKTLEQVKVQINDINVTAGKINTTLGEVTKKQGEINSSISNLEQTAGSIKTSIEGFKETEAEIKATANKIESTHAGIVLEASEKSAQKAIDGLEIGGRNYLINTDISLVSVMPWDSAEYSLEDDVLVIKPKSGVRFAAGFSLSESIPVGTLVTLTFDYSLNIKPDYDYIYITKGVRVAGGQIHIGNFKTYDGSWDRLTIKFKVPDNTYKVLYIGWQSSSKDAMLKLKSRNISIQSNKPTDWSPAPEDTDAQITETNTSLKVLNDQLLAEVSKTDGINRELTAVKQDHNSFKIQVKTDITGAINSNNEVIKSSFEMKDNKISLLGAEIDITGKVTFSALNSESQNKINTANSTASTALSNANNAQSSANNALMDIYDFRDEVGDLAYADKVEKAQLGTTVIEGGFLKTELIRANSITADKLNVGSLLARHLRTADAGPRIEATGSEMKIYGIGEHPNIVLGVNTQGYAVLAYYSNDGQLIYDLGPRGINWGSIKPESWTETKLVGPITTGDDPKFFDFNLYTNTDSYRGHTYYRYFAGSNPTITAKEKEKENYIYTMKGNFNSKISDGWYMMEGTPGMSIAGNTTAFVRPFGEDGIYEWGTGVRDIPPIYFRMVMQYKGGQIYKTKYVCWNGPSDTSGGMLPPNSGIIV